VLYEKFAILGLATGSLYALTALGIVIVSRASGVLNFSSGAVGAFGAYLTYDLIDNHGVPSWVGVIIGIALGALIGVVTHWIVMVLLRKSGPLSKLIATLALLTLLEGVVTLIWGSVDLGTPNPILPSTLRSLDGVTFTEDRVWLIGIALLGALILKLVYTRTSFGLDTAAVAENREVAAISGLSATRIEVVNFAIAGAISAAAGILLAPILGLDVTSLVVIIIPALAAALVGRFTSFGITVAAALFIGVLQSEIPELGFVRNNVDGVWAGLPDAVPVILIVVITAIRGRGRLQKPATAAWFGTSQCPACCDSGRRGTRTKRLCIRRMAVCTDDHLRLCHPYSLSCRGHWICRAIVSGPVSDWSIRALGICSR
jgi:branched-subunit amino acid ABC-type transport system permease component